MFVTVNVTTTMPSRTIKIHQFKYSTLIEGNLLATNYADYEKGFEQWQIWAQQRSNEQRRRRSRNNRRSLLIESVDPRVENHMRWVPANNKNLESKIGAKRAALPTIKEPRRRWLSHGNNKTPKRTGTDGEYVTLHGEQHRYKNDFESVCSTLPVSESDDSSDGRGGTASRVLVSDSTIPFNLQMSRSFVIEQEAMIRAMEQNQRQQQQQVKCRAPKKPDVEPNVTLLPADRVKRAMERGDSIRMLECSGCCRRLLVTPDFPLVYCAGCQCFSRLDNES